MCICVGLMSTTPVAASILIDGSPFTAVPVSSCVKEEGGGSSIIPGVSDEKPSWSTLMLSTWQMAHHPD